jgi:hypothetical protein
MEGGNASALIATRMGIYQGEVGSKLVSLHRKGELDGTADRPSQPMPDADEDNGDISLTIKDLEEFKKAEAEAKGNTRAPPATLYKLTLKPAVLGDPATPSASAPSAAPSAAPLTPSASASAPAPSAALSAAPSTPSASESASAPSAERQEGSGSGEVAMVPSPDADLQSPLQLPQSGLMRWR